MDPTQRESKDAKLADNENCLRLPLGESMDAEDTDTATSVATSENCSPQLGEPSSSKNLTTVPLGESTDPEVTDTATSVTTNGNCTSRLCEPSSSKLLTAEVHPQQSHLLYFVCPLCPAGFRTNMQQINHIINEHNSTIEYVDKILANMDFISCTCRHTEERKQNTQYEGPPSSERSREPSSSKVLTSVPHGESIDVEDTNAVTSVTTSEICSSQLGEPSSSKVLAAEVDPQQSHKMYFLCPMCPARYRKTMELVNHIIDMHNSTSEYIDSILTNMHFDNCCSCLLTQERKQNTQCKAPSPSERSFETQSCPLINNPEALVSSDQSDKEADSTVDIVTIPKPLRRSGRLRKRKDGAQE